jgi:hypothetical protein
MKQTKEPCIAAYEIVSIPVMFLAAWAVIALCHGLL